MNTLGQWSLEELAHRLATVGVCLDMAPFVVRIRSPIPIVAEAMHALYAENNCLADGVFVDFHVGVAPKTGFFKKLCVFEMDGFRPFTPLARGEAFAFLEWGLNWCVTNHCHTWLSIHSAVLEKNGRALILPAPPGSGKSTLCAALMLHGWRLLSDEMTLLDPGTGLVQPFVRPVSLKNESIEVVRRLAPEAVIGPVAHDTMKGHVAHLKVSQASRLQSAVAADPAWVVFPRYVRDGSVGLQSAARPKASALVELASNSFNHHVHGKNGFHALTRLIDRCGCHDFAYSDLPEALAWFDALEPTP